MNQELLAQMKDKYQGRLDANNYNVEVFEKVKELGSPESIQRYMKLYNEYQERNKKGRETEEKIIQDIYNAFMLSLKDIKEEDTNRIYYLTRRNVYEMLCENDVYCYDNFPISGYTEDFGNVITSNYGDIFTNLENSKYWYFIPKEYQIEFRENYYIVNSDDVSLYHLAQKYFFESAIKYGEEEAIKRVLKRKF